MLAPVRSYGNLEDIFEFDLRECKFLGEGHNGIVYLLPDGRVIKIFKDSKNCKKEYLILKGASGSKYFPRAYLRGGNYIIRDYVGGVCAKDYIKKNGLSRKLACNMLDLLEEFKRLKFTKLDIRCRDLFVQDDESIVVIDPKSSYSRNIDFPRHLAKGLAKLNVLGQFLDAVKSRNPELYDTWTQKLSKAGILKKKDTQ